MSMPIKYEQGQASHLISFLPQNLCAFSRLMFTLKVSSCSLRKLSPTGFSYLRLCFLSASHWPQHGITSCSWCPQESPTHSICVKVAVGPSDVSGLFNLQPNLHIQREVGVPSPSHPQWISARQLRFTFLWTETQASQGWGVGLFCSLLIFPASGSFPVSQLFVPDGQSTGASASTPILPINIQDWFRLGLTSLISFLWFWEILKAKGEEGGRRWDG